MKNFNPVPFSEAKKYVKKTLAAVEANVFNTREEAREGIKKPWEDGTLSFYQKDRFKEVSALVENGLLQVSKPWQPHSPEVLNDESIIKIETGEGQGLVFEHRQNAKKRGVLTSNSSGQVLYEYKASYEEVVDRSKDSEFVAKIKSVEKFALGDDDLGAALTYWLLTKIKEGEDVMRFKEIVDLVSLHDKRGRLLVYPSGESYTSLVMINWGIILSTDNDTEKISKYMSVFDYLSENPHLLHGGLKFPDKKSAETLDAWVIESRKELEKAEINKDYIICRDCTVLNGQTKWDQVCVDGYRKFDGKKAVFTIAPANEKGEKEMQVSTYGYYYMTPFGEYLKSKGLSPWYGEGYVGLYSSSEYSDVDFVADYEKFMSEHRESIEQSTEFEVVWDDEEYMKNVMDFALSSGMITGYTQTPEYYEAKASYLWDEYGTELEEGKEKHTKINTDKIKVARFLCAQGDKEKVLQYLNRMFGKRDSYPEGYKGKQVEGWIAPLIKATDKGVNKKFASYLEANAN